MYRAPYSGQISVSSEFHSDGVSDGKSAGGDDQQDQDQKDEKRQFLATQTEKSVNAATAFILLATAFMLVFLFAGVARAAEITMLRHRRYLLIPKDWLVPGPLFPLVIKY
jgi:hypothetical protein